MGGHVPHSYCNGAAVPWCSWVPRPVSLRLSKGTSELGVPGAMDALPVTLEKCRPLKSLLVANHKPTGQELTAPGKH